VKDQVYSQRVNMLDELQAQITVRVANCTQDYRWNIFRAAADIHCEVFHL
jgi:hypothetical protein